MEWRVIDVIYLERSGTYALVVQSGRITIQVDVSSTTPVSRGDTLYPLENARYALNGDPGSVIKAIAAVPFSRILWRALTMMV